MTTPAPADASLPLPLDDPYLASPDLDLRGLAAHWAARSTLRPMTAEAMRGADLRAQRLGVPGDRLMEQAGFAVAAAARAVLRTADRPGGAVVLVLCGPGNNGGDGFVAARHLAHAGIRAAAVLVSADGRPGTADAARNWERLGGVDGVERIHAGSAHDVAMLHNGLERAALIVDALLGTGVRGLLREPVRTAVDLITRAHSLGVPVLAVDTPTAVDLTSGEPSDPVVRADVTVTFHRPKQGLLGRAGKALAGRVLVAPIGIPAQADPS
jgi:ADP-dependent NAD(P)H-hydrate dehydratase / NAD(P)H-hydrate epimerase